MGDSLSGKNNLSKENFLKMGKIAQNAKRSKGLLNAFKKKAFENLKKFGGMSESEFNKKVKGLTTKITNDAIAGLASKGMTLDQFNEKMDAKTGMDKIVGKTKKVGDVKKLKKTARDSRL